MRGEKFHRKIKRSLAKGSPPRVRGKVLWHFNVSVCPGITPARAGKSAELDPAGDGFEDHPRACGEKTPACRNVCNVLGSPPRVRGKAYTLDSSAAVFGITPARAGKSCCSSSRFCICWDHPRACGEKRIPTNSDSFKSGSPPRVRGKVIDDGVLPPKVGITPARAGKSRKSVISKRSYRDHPRACGEK